MALISLVNTTAGSVPEDGDMLLRYELGSALTRQFSCSGKDIARVLASIELRDRDTLIVWGGDGTVAAALNLVRGTGALVLPLPGGTMNLLHRRIHGQAADWKTTLTRALCSRQPRELTYATANGLPFYVALMLGRLTQLVEAREALREGQPLEAVRQAASAGVLDMESIITTRIGTEELRATAAAAFLPEALEGDCLEIGAIDPDSLIDLATVGLTSLISDWREAEGVTFRQTGEAWFHQQAEPGRNALLDGEPAEFEDPIRVELRRGDVLVHAMDGTP